MTIGKNGAMQMSTQKKKQTPIEKLAALIVDKRKAFYLFYIIAGIFCAISTGWTKVNNDITSYLPDLRLRQHNAGQRDLRKGGGDSL